MAIAKSRRGVVNRLSASPSQVRFYFVHVPGLLANFPLEVCLAYMFSKVELAQNMTLYCGVVKLHRANPMLARAALDLHHLTRENFKAFFEKVFGTPIPETINAVIGEAEGIRDRVMHGKTTSAKDMRQALMDVIDYAQGFNDFVFGIGGFRPFGGDLRGFKGRAQSLDRSTTRWVLKGMGFGLS